MLIPMSVSGNYFCKSCPIKMYLLDQIKDPVYTWSLHASCVSGLYLDKTPTKTKDVNKLEMQISLKPLIRLPKMHSTGKNPSCTTKTSVIFQLIPVQTRPCPHLNFYIEISVHTATKHLIEHASPVYGVIVPNKEKQQHTKEKNRFNPKICVTSPVMKFSHY